MGRADTNIKFVNSFSCLFLLFFFVFLLPNTKQFRRCSTQPGLTIGGVGLENDARMGSDFWLWVTCCQNVKPPHLSRFGAWVEGTIPRANKTCVNLNIFDFKINLIYMLFLSGALNWYWLNVRVENFGRECVIAAVTVRCNIICSGGLSKPHPIPFEGVWERALISLNRGNVWEGGQSREKVSVSRTSVIECVH